MIIRIEELVDEIIAYRGRARARRRFPVSIITFHATRGGNTPEMQYPATKRWFAELNRTRNALRGWGPMSDALVGVDARSCLFGDWRTTRANWSAGYGRWRRLGSWGLCVHDFCIEIAQTNQLEPMSEVSLDKAAQLAAAVIDDPDTRIDAPTWLKSVSQASAAPVPIGIIGHDGSANGRKLGKSDPGWTDLEWRQMVLRIEGHLGDAVPVDLATHRHLAIEPGTTATHPTGPPIASA